MLQSHHLLTSSRVIFPKFLRIMHLREFSEQCRLKNTRATISCNKFDGNYGQCVGGIRNVFYVFYFKSILESSTEKNPG